MNCLYSRILQVLSGLPGKNFITSPLTEFKLSRDYSWQKTIMRNPKTIVAKRTCHHTMCDEFEFIHPIPEDRYCDVIVHLRNNFFADEPLKESVALSQPGEPHPELEAHSLLTLRDHLSVMVVDRDSQEVAGASLNGVLLPGDIKQELKRLGSITDEKFKRMLSILYEVLEDLDLFSKYKVDKIFDIRALSVDSNYRAKGLGKRLIRQALDVARENDFKIIKTEATSVFSQRVFREFGFEVVEELKYDDYFDENGEQIFKISPPHESLQVMIKILDKHCF